MLVTVEAIVEQAGKAVDNHRNIVRNRPCLFISKSIMRPEIRVDHADKLAVELKGLGYSRTTREQWTKAASDSTLISELIRLDRLEAQIICSDERLRSELAKEAVKAAMSSMG